MVRVKQILRLGFKTRRYEIDSKDIRDGTFELLANRRKISMSAVNGISENLTRGKHFDSSFVVNKVNGKYRLIDGNHRYEAIVKYLSAYPGNRVEVILHIYEGMSVDTEKQLYTTYNTGRKQSTNDFIQQYKEEIPIWKLMSDATKFPIKVTVYPSPGSVTFYKLVGSYISATKPRFPGGYIGRPLDFVDEVKNNLGNSDVNLMSQFIQEYQQAFGPVKNNVWFRTTPLNAIFRIWIDNRDHLKPDTMITLFKKKLAMDGRAIDLGKSGGLGAATYAREQYIILLNTNRGRDLFANKDQEFEVDLDEDSNIEEQENPIE